jgi:tetratricopeptide (TPR) repeat protein
MTPDERPSAGVPGPGLQPPGSHLLAGERKTGQHGLVWLALAFVIILSLLVLLVLPKLVSGTSDEGAGSPATQVAAGTPQSAGQESAGSRKQAEQALQDFLHTRARLELANVTAWGEPEWSRAVEAADRGNSHFSQRQFAMAAEAFTAASGLLILLESEREQRLAAAIDAGWQALEADDSAGAIGFFENAKAIDAGSLDALDGLERARVRPDLLRLMAEGDMARSNQNLPAAQTAYRDALALDEAYEPAEAALRDVTEAINELAFGDAMSRALSALQAEQIETAEKALRQAASLKPDAAVVRNTQQELAQAKQGLWLAAQRRAVAAAESGEDWPGAVAIYREVLARMPQAAFARQGLEFAEDRERLHQQLDHYLQDSTRLWSDQPRANAEQLLASAANPRAGETRLAEKIRRLQALIVEATTPTTVTLRSDGLTSVQIYHVGRLGQFISQQLELRPGTYTVVGSRPGYRDVRQTLTVKPGPEQPSLDIRCEETV